MNLYQFIETLQRLVDDGHGDMPLMFHDGITEVGGVCLLRVSDGLHSDQLQIRIIPEMDDARNLLQ